ncbi:uncharacterized protein LOC142340123 isoform X2 [Convolutriloba macropyga]
MTVSTSSSTGAGAQWSLCGQLSNYVSKLIPTPTGDTVVLFLNTPHFEFIKEILDLGVQVHIVEQDKTIGEKLIEFLKDGPNALTSSESMPSTYVSEDKRLTLHNMLFRNYYCEEMKFNVVFDLGVLPILPNNREVRRLFGEKLISICAEGAKMAFFNAEKMSKLQQGEIKELSVIDLNAAFGRNFHFTKEVEVENPLGYSEILYLAHKTAIGGIFYDEKYSKGYSPWHMDTVNYNLLKHYNRIQPEGEPLRKILVPMSGKTVDIKWLADKGHEVVAVEISQSACRQIFTRDNIPFEEIDCPQVEGKLFKPVSGRIKAYCCDVFKFTKEVEGEFESVWERGAVIAFEEDLRKKYFEHVKTLVSKGCSWMSSIFQYDRNVYYNHPYCLNDDEIERVFSDGQFSYEKIDETVYTADREYTEEEAENVMVKLVWKNQLKSVSDSVYLYSKLSDSPH